MLKARWQQTLTQLWHARNGYLCLAAGLVGIVLLQSVALCMVAGKTRIIVTPASISKSFWVDDQHVSASYLSEMTLYFASLLLNVTADNAAFQREAVLRYTDPAGYAALKAHLLEQEAKLKTESLTIAFYPVDMIVNPTTLTAWISGDVKIWVGEQLTTTMRQTFQARYTYHAGRLLLATFEEMKTDAQTTER